MILPFIFDTDGLDSAEHWRRRSTLENLVEWGIAALDMLDGDPDAEGQEVYRRDGKAVAVDSDLESDDWMRGGQGA